jgi:putative transposase
VSVKYAFIASEEGHYPVSRMCAWARVSRSGFYDWTSRAPSARARRREELAVLVRFSFEESDGTYGYRRVHADLARWGYRVDDETVRAIMREEGLVACQPRPFRPVTTLAGDAGETPDLLRRDFPPQAGGAPTATEPGTRLVGDITYIPTWQGWVYLATVLDCFSKKVVGYAMAEHLRTELVTDALAMAARNGRTRSGVTVFHSDRGTQYTSEQFANYTNELGVTRSVGRTGVCFDNAWAESFNGTLKNERVNRTAYPTREHARIDVTRWIELRYNRRRLHSALGYRTPDEVEEAWNQQNQAA